MSQNGWYFFVNWSSVRGNNLSSRYSLLLFFTGVRRALKKLGAKKNRKKKLFTGSLDVL